MTDWVPLTLPRLTGEKLCPYTEPRQGRKHFWEWIAASFPDECQEARQRFVKLLAAVMLEACDPADRRLLCLSDVPSPTTRQTRAPYSANEAAAWWNAAVEKMPPALMRRRATAAPAPEPLPTPAPEPTPPAPAEPPPIFPKRRRRPPADFSSFN